MGEFRRTQSKVWWANFPEDEDDEVSVSSPSLLPGWGPGVSLSPDRGSPSNGSHKSQDSGFSDSEGSPPIPKPPEGSSEESDDQKNVKLADTPLARIPRVCLARYKTRRDKCLDSAWTAGETGHTAQTFSRFNQSDCIVAGGLERVNAVEEATTSFVVESEEEAGSKKLPKIYNANEITGQPLLQESTTDISSNSAENQTALFIPKPSPVLRSASPRCLPSPDQRLRPPQPPYSPCLGEKSPQSLPPPTRLESPSSPPSRPFTPTSQPSNWNSELDLTDNLGDPKHCSTPKSVSCKKLQLWNTREHRPNSAAKLFER